MKRIPLIKWAFSFFFPEYTYPLAFKREIWKTDVKSFKESIPQFKKINCFFFFGQGVHGEKRYLLSYDIFISWKYYFYMPRTSWGQNMVPTILSTKRSDFFFLTTKCLTMLSANVLNVSFAFQFSTHPKHTKSPSELLINKRQPGLPHSKSLKRWGFS